MGTHPTPGSPSALVSVEFVGNRAEILLKSGPLNLVTRPMLHDLYAAIRAVRDRDGVRCVILHGGPARALCAGSDNKEFAHLGEDASEMKILLEDCGVRSLAQLPMPTIAAIDGPALGGWLELALACDLRVMAAGATVGLTEARPGGLAGSGSVRLARLIGPARAQEMLFTAPVIAARQALAWGIVNQIAEGSALEAAITLADEITERGTLANGLGKQLADAALDRLRSDLLFLFADGQEMGCYRIGSSRNVK